MTTDFNNQLPNGSRPPSRNVPSGRYREEQSSRPARPRLNRAMVDRGWENGTTRQHADYHPRTNNEQATRNHWHKNQEREYSSYNSPTGNRTSGNRQSHYNSRVQHIEPSYNDGYGPRKRPFDSKGHHTENRRFNNEYGNTNGQYGSNNYRAQNNQKRVQGHSPNFRTQEHLQERPSNYRSKHSQTNMESNKGYNGLNGRLAYDNQRQKTQNSRIQNRPEAFQKRQEERRLQKTALSPETTTENKRRVTPSQTFPNKQAKPAAIHKQAKHTTDTPRSKKTGADQPPSTRQRPWQRGFKWPKPSETP